MDLVNYKRLVEDRVETIAITARGYSPIAMPIISGIGLVFAFYDGGSRVLIGTGVNSIIATIIATVAGVVVTVLIEGMTIATMFTEDETRQVPDYEKDKVLSKAPSNKQGMFFATLASIFMLESGPALWSLWEGSVSPELAIFRIGLIVFPFFSRIAASTFSINQLLNVALREKRAENAIHEVELSVKIDTARRKQMLLSEIDIAGAVDEKRARVHAKLAKLGANNAPLMLTETVTKSENEGVNGSVNEVETGGKSDEEIMLLIAEALVEEPSISTRKLGGKLGVSHTKVGQLIAQLVESEVFSVSSGGKGKPNSYTPNGRFDEYMAASQLVVRD